MTNEDQNNQEEVMNEDNLLTELDEFNSGSSPEPEVEEPQEEEVLETQPDENNDNEEPNEQSQVEQWLIENKFANDEEGVQKLADAYKQLQSKSDKDRNEWANEKGKYEKLAQLDEFLSNNPDVVQKLTESVQEKQKDMNAPPVKPDDYDILDESIENSSSAKWRAEHDKWLISQGATQAMLEVEKLKSELSQSQAFDAETIELQKMGLSDTDIVEYRQFMADPNNVSQENLVEIWKTLSNKGNNSKPEVAQQAPKVKNKQNSAASVSGNAPQAIEPEEKAVDDFWKGIMEFNNTNT
jgi:hypothetical protein|tara:strand:+ start:1311 stop:2201 length:891 start_codon:yes stop_codon:yes gene_type:complete